MEICESYRKLQRVVDVANAFGINERTVRNILKENGVRCVPRELRNRRYDFDRSFFETVNVPEKAYMLGFIFGDASIYNDRMSIEIASKDECLLDDFRSIIGPGTPPIKHRTRTRNGTETHSSSLILCGKEFVRHLRKFDRKLFPNIDDRLVFDFIRGLSDSDGCIRIDSCKRATWQVIGHHDICKGVASCLDQHGIPSSVKQTSYEGLSRVIVRKKSDIIRLRSLLYYTDTVVCLARKRDVFSKVKYKGG